MSDTYGAGMADELDDEDKAIMSGGGEEPVAEPVDAPAVEPAAQEPSTESEEDNDGEEVTEVNGGRFIRHGAFHRERKMRQAMERQAQDLQQRVTQEQVERARINERLAILMQATQQQLPSADGEQPQVPNPEEDPFAYMRYLESRLNQQEQTTQQVDQRFQAQDSYGAAKTAFMSDASAYVQRQPDFMDAYNHLIQSRGRELALLGRSDPRERQQIIAQEEHMMVREALNQGRSPSELFYALAQDRGYRKAEPAPAASAAPQQRTAVDQVKAIATAQAASKSLSNVAGGGVSTPTAESLANMPEEEFISLYAKMSRQQQREYFGG